MAPGILYVTMAPSATLPPAQFHDWYDNEHGPTRLRLPHIFPNGLRFRATDALDPHYLAVYDVADMAHLETPTYTSLRANRSAREAETIGQVAVDRRFYDLLGERRSPLWMPLEELTDDEAQGLVLVVVEFEVKGGDAAEAEKGIGRWYEEEHMELLSRVPGWLRTRRFRTSAAEGAGSGPTRLVALHEYARENGLGGPEHKASMDTKWREEVYEKYVEKTHRRTFELFYVFGPAPRDLESLAQLSETAAFEAPDGKTRTTPGSHAVISSFVTTADGLEMPYRLEGNPSPAAPTVAFCNSLLTNLHMWDPLVKNLKAERPDLRILRYDTRGRHDVPEPPKPSTLDILADDISGLLDALRIPKLHALVGVSMGGATTLKFALKYPERLERFVACDFNVASSESNTQAWKDRIAVAEGEAPEKGIKTLAKMTVERWFHPSTMSYKKDVADWMINMVGENNIRGFRYGCQALWDYNMKEAMKDCRVPGLFVVGDGDGKGALVKAMDNFKGLLGEKGAELRIVKDAGHLPMCENPADFWEEIKGFL